MVWFFWLAAGVVYLLWWRDKRPKKKPKEESRRKAEASKPDDPEDEIEPDFTQLIGCTAEITPSRRFSPEEEQAWKEKKRKEQIEREKNAIPWCSDTSLTPPIRMLTQNQYYCLEMARLRFSVVKDDPDALSNYQGKNEVTLHVMRTINSLLKHQMLESAGDGSYQITNLGLRALETLPVRGN